MKQFLILAACVATLAPGSLAAQPLSEDTLLRLARERGICTGGQVPVAAHYAASGRVAVRCGASDVSVSTQSPKLGSLGVGGGVIAGVSGMFLLAVLNGRGGAPADTLD